MAGPIGPGRTGRGSDGIGAAVIAALGLWLLAVAFAGVLVLVVGTAVDGFGDDDTFTAATAVFSVLTGAVVAVAVISQQRHLSAQNERVMRQLTMMAESNRIQANRDVTEQFRLNLEVTGRALEDDELLAVLDTYGDDIPAERRRQFLYANMVYMQVLHAYQVDTHPEAEVRGAMAIHLQNPVFREYWEATRLHRRTLQPGSPENRLAAITDDVLRRLEDEEQRREWWRA
ncbi:hypothetical protein G5C51_20795 [Streptomyces sp. A7024]|uniref:Uncharacterized protein n=1 Tax=Streptomyces coryli TaxID=1128680 RepID=A0A6G4U3N5_9ACTN|nr:DUF6082 family protein [Streptomyces coryli]NGN66326.1 hypothetical protein [Streptomyces coryli]